MNIQAKLVEKISKTGNPYVCIELSISDKIKKLVFLTQAEVELIRLMSANSK